jgi:deoxycytidine triphosphate deaminase
MLHLCDFETDYTTEQDMAETDGKAILMPGETILAITLEEIYLGPQMAAQVHSKSSLGRLMQTAHAGGAGFCDAGFRGYVTLEIINFLPRPVVYTSGMMVAQLTFTRLDTEADPVYDMRGGQYSNKLAAPMPAKKIKMGGSNGYNTV